MKRYHQELPRIRREHRIRLRHLQNRPDQPVLLRNLQAGRFRKSHARGCPNKGCHLCKYDKLCHIPTARDRRLHEKADADLREWWEYGPLENHS